MMRRMRRMRTPTLVSLLFLAAACGGETPDPSAPKAPEVASASAAPVASTPPTQAPASVVTKRVVVSLSRRSGTDVTTVLPDGTVTVAFDVLSNGRGPHSDATIRLAKDGTLLSLSSHGHHLMGTLEEESFTRDGDHVTWTSREEHGDTSVHGAAFFVPFSEVPDAVGYLAQALIAGGGTMPLLPAGQAKIEKTGDATVQIGGKDTHINGYAITGLDLTPTRIWMNDDGTWWGSVSPWFSIVPEGAESTIEPLIAKQNELDHARDTNLAKTLAHTPAAAGLAFTHARVLDVEHGKWMLDQTVLVVGDKIQSIGPSKSAKVPAGAEVTDLAGKAILPGLWDMHVHTGDSDGVLNIASGVTTVRDVGNDPDKLDDYKKRYDSGTAVGPHVIRYGLIEGRNAKAASSKVTAETPEEAKAGVAAYKARGYEGIKIYNSVRPELVPIITKEAHAQGMAVTGHIPVHMLANEAVNAGYDGIEHINMLFLNFFATHDTDTRDTTRFTLVGENAAAFDLKSKPVTDFVALLKKHDTLIDPTLDAFEDLFYGEQGKVIPGLEGIANRLPVQIQRQFLAGGLPLEGDRLKTYKASYEKLLVMTKLLHDAKVRIVVGTDTLAGVMLHHELALFVRAGLTPAETLRAATIEPARAMKQDKTSGSIAVGKTADLFIVDGDPLANIADATKIVSTVKSGVVYDCGALYDTVGVRH